MEMRTKCFIALLGTALAVLVMYGIIGYCMIKQAL